MKSNGVKKGDRVTIYMPMIPEAAYAMLACTRIGAIHSIVFGGFSPDALAGRIVDCESTFVITADEGLRGGKKIPLKHNTDLAIEIAQRDGVTVKKVLVVQRTAGKIEWFADRDIWYHEATAAAKPDCKPAKMKAEDPLFILYTSGSTGKPKGVLHTTGGYLVYASMTHEYVFDYHEGDIYWCTADVGWVTGHSYIVYGPLANGATTLMFEGVPNYPSPSRFWDVVDKHKVNIFYTAPTAIRALMGAGDDHVKKTSRKSLRTLGSVGEPINPEAWEWYYNVVGEKKCPIVDTWWQTETGGILITPLPGATKLKPGSATRGRSSACSRSWWTMMAMCSKVPPRAICASSIPGRDRCARSMATTSASSRPISPPTRASTSPVTAAAVTKTAITGSPAASMT
jgi:acetyl-CoA synthetase